MGDITPIEERNRILAAYLKLRETLASYRDDIAWHREAKWHSRLGFGDIDIEVQQVLDDLNHKGDLQ